MRVATASSSTENQSHSLSRLHNLPHLLLECIASYFSNDINGTMALLGRDGSNISHAEKLLEMHFQELRNRSINSCYFEIISWRVVRVMYNFPSGKFRCMDICLK